MKITIYYLNNMKILRDQSYAINVKYKQRMDKITNQIIANPVTLHTQ